MSDLLLVLHIIFVFAAEYKTIPSILDMTPVIQVKTILVYLPHSSSTWTTILSSFIWKHKSFTHAFPKRIWDLPILSFTLCLNHACHYFILQTVHLVKTAPSVLISFTSVFLKHFFTVYHHLFFSLLEG